MTRTSRSVGARRRRGARLKPPALVELPIVRWRSRPEVGRSRDRMLGVPITREAVAAVLLALGVSGGAYRLVRLQAGAQTTTDRCGRGDKPGQDKEVPVAPRGVQIAAHYIWVDDEESPHQVHDVEGDVTDEHTCGQGHQGRGVVEARAFSRLRGAVVRTVPQF